MRAWDVKRPLLFAPAMNTLMWEHPLTAKHIAVLKEFGYQEVPCIEKLLACGDKGIITSWLYFMKTSKVLCPCSDI